MTSATKHLDLMFRRCTEFDGVVLVVVLVLVNALGLLGPPQLAIYLAGLGWMLFFSISPFVCLVLGPGPATGAAE